MDKYSWQAIKISSWHGTFHIRNNIVRKSMLFELNKNVNSMTYFLRHYVSKFESNVDLTYIASNEMDNRSLLALCKYLCDKDGYVAFSSISKYKKTLRKINKAAEELYEKTLYYLLCYYSVGLVVTSFVCVISLLWL